MANSKSDTKSTKIVLDAINEMLARYPISQLSTNDEVELTRTVISMFNNFTGDTPEFELMYGPGKSLQVELRNENENQ